MDHTPVVLSPRGFRGGREALLVLAWAGLWCRDGARHRTAVLVAVVAGVWLAGAA